MLSGKRVSAIAAVDLNGVFSQDGGMPWGISKVDMDHFKTITQKKTVVMGRMTWESLPPRFRPLPNRENIVVTSQNVKYIVPGAKVAGSLVSAIEMSTSSDVVLIGGRNVWLQGLASGFVDEAWVTVMEMNCKQDSGTLLCQNLLHLPVTYGGNQTGVTLQDRIDGEDVRMKVLHWTRGQ